MFGKSHSIPGLNYTSPNTFTLRQRIALSVLPFAGVWCMRAIHATCRYEVRNAAKFEAYRKQYGRELVAFWHESMALAGWHYRNTGSHTLTSYSYDGEMAARFMLRLGCRACRGSSSRGGGEGLRELVKVLEHRRLVGFTLDGPRGPRREAKPGIAILAARTVVPIIPQAFVISPAWRLNSWDRFPVPKPFGRIVSMYGDPVAPPPDESREAIEETRRQIETALNGLHAEIEDELGVDSVDRVDGVD